jgi:hypothetical protein
MVCERVPVDLLVMVAAMVPKPGESGGEWWSNTRHKEAQREQDLRDGRDPDAPFDVKTVFFHDVPEDVVEEASTAVLEHNRIRRSRRCGRSQRGLRCPRASCSAATIASFRATSCAV